MRYARIAFALLIPALAASPLWGAPAMADTQRELGSQNFALTYLDLPLECATFFPPSHVVPHPTADAIKELTDAGYSEAKAASLVAKWESELKTNPPPPLPPAVAASNYCSDMIYHYYIHTYPNR